MLFEAEETSLIHQTALKICKKTLVSNVSPTKFLERLQKSGLVEDNDAKEILVRLDSANFSRNYHDTPFCKEPLFKNTQFSESTQIWLDFGTKILYSEILLVSGIC